MVRKKNRKKRRKGKCEEKMEVKMKLTLYSPDFSHGQVKSFGVRQSKNGL